MSTLISPIEIFLRKFESISFIQRKRKKKLSQGTLAHLKGQHVKAVQKWKSGLFILQKVIDLIVCAIIYRRPSLYVVFISAILRICD